MNQLSVANTHPVSPGRPCAMLQYADDMLIVLKRGTKWGDSSKNYIR